MPWIATLLFFAAVLVPTGEAQRPRWRPDPTADPAYLEVEASYRSALQVYDQARVEAARGRAPAPTVHPASEFWGRMEAVAAAGSAHARRWLCENVAQGVSDPARRLPVVEAQIDALLACCAGDAALLGAVTALRQQAQEFGEPVVLRHLDRIATRATNPEVQARALFESSQVVAGRGEQQDPARKARADELRNAVVHAFPQTKAAREAAQYLMVDVTRALLAAMDAWLARALEAAVAGQPAAEWPEHPFIAAEARIAPLAATGFHDAKSWIEDLYPAFANARELAPDIALSLLARELGRHYGPRDVRWGPLRMRALELAVRVGGGEAPWLRSTLEALSEQAPEIVPLAPLPFTRAVLELAQASEPRAHALWIEAQTRLAEGSEAHFLGALAALDELVARHADMAGLTEKAAAEAARVRAVAPGAKLPDSRTAEWGIRDVEDLELVLAGYRGRVLLLESFDPLDSTWEPLAAERRALVERFAGRPFALVGLIGPAMTRQVARQQFEKLGIGWRCGLLQSSNHPYLQTLYLRRPLPAFLLVDAQGVIRARNRPFEELTRLAEELVAEAERAAPGR
ncbi:MAG: hypothetical protein JNK02_13540 [Planctomycetes bacterium]|nr:hypothetical protein [Planctomycetota bacterium]